VRNLGFSRRKGVWGKGESLSPARGFLRGTAFPLTKSLPKIPKKGLTMKKTCGKNYS